MRLIDADALARDMGVDNAVKYGNETAEQQHNSYSTLMKYEIAYYIEDAPTIDAMPVVHAKWLTNSDKPDTLICSECGRRFDMYFFDQKDMPYCLCGARMDGGADRGV